MARSPKDPTIPGMATQTEPDGPVYKPYVYNAPNEIKWGSIVMEKVGTGKYRQKPAAFPYLEVTFFDDGTYKEDTVTGPPMAVHQSGGGTYSP